MILAMMFGDLQLPPKTNMLLIDACLSEGSVLLERHTYVNCFTNFSSLSFSFFLVLVKMSNWITAVWPVQQQSAEYHEYSSPRFHSTKSEIVYQCGFFCNNFYRFVVNKVDNYEKVTYSKTPAPVSLSAISKKDQYIFHLILFGVTLESWKVTLIRAQCRLQSCNVFI